jgi:amino acid adenylation domain-containing protein
MKASNVQTLFDLAASRHRLDTAIVYKNRRVSYEALKGRSDRLASLLVASGARKGTVVAILCEDAVEVVSSIIAALKAGCVFVPLDLAMPDRRLRAMLDEVSPGWLITESHLLGRVTGVAAEGPAPRVICTDLEHPHSISGEGLQEIFGLSASLDAEGPRVESGPDDMCYIYFTSGSTGKPKGIAGRLKSIDHFIRWEIETFSLDETVRVSHLAPASFDASLRDIFVPLCLGGTLHIPPDRETILDGGRLASWIDREQITLLHCVPSVFRSLTNEPLRPEQFASLKQILMAGEPLLPSDVGRWCDVFGDRVQLANLYGPSETTMVKFCYMVSPSDRRRQSIPIGKPIEGAKALLLDERGKPSRQGTVGEIYIRTPFRTLGYYNQPELTREAFVQNPFSDDPDDIVYRTGDMGRVLQDGNFEYLGRRDQQVKIRGVRVELAEIEGLLRAHEAVIDVAVIDRKDAKDYTFLCAYLVLSEQIDPYQLREYLAEHLPEHALPSAFVTVEVLPRTLSGKIDRRALPAPGAVRSGSEIDYIAPRTPTEEVITVIWSELLGVKKIGVNDNFFHLGGHSLLATQLLSRVRQVFFVDVPLRSLFETPTVASLSLRVTQAQVEEVDDEEISSIIAELKGLSGEALERMIQEEIVEQERAL